MDSSLTVERCVRIASSKLTTLNSKFSTTTENLQLSSRETSANAIAKSFFASIDMNVGKFRHTVDELSNSYIRHKVDVVSLSKDVSSVIVATISGKRFVENKTIPNTVHVFVNVDAVEFSDENDRSNSSCIFGCSCHSITSSAFTLGIRINGYRVADTTNRSIGMMPNSLLLLYEGFIRIFVVMVQ